MLRIAAILVALLAATSADARQSCRMVWQCNPLSSCKQIRVCGLPLAITSPRPPDKNGTPLPTVPPVKRYQAPPSGKLLCRQVRVCDGDLCRWQSVCSN